MAPAGVGIDLVAGVLIWTVLWIAWEVARWSPLTG